MRLYYIVYIIIIETAYHTGVVTMPKTFTHFTFLLFIITALSGLWMRAIPFLPNSVIPYSNILHGHSHLAILGWAFLGVFIILLAILWPSIKNKQHAIMLTITIFIVSLVMFIAFLLQGYALFSIILSTIHIFVEYWAIMFIYQQLKTQNKLPEIGSLFIKGSLITLFISSIGPFTLAYVSANKLQDTALFDMAIYFYLHFQYNGWLFLFLIGTFLCILHHKGLNLDIPLLKIGYWLYFIALFPWYLLSILWVDLGSYGHILATIGSIGQWIAILLIIMSLRSIWRRICDVVPKVVEICLTITLILLFFKSTMELGLIFPSLGALVYETRSVIIGYLHFTLLGFVSIFILTQYQLLNILDSTKKVVQFGFIIFFSGFVLNELLLFIMGLFSWLHITTIPFYTEGLLLASILLSIGISILWATTFRKSSTRR